MLLQTVKEKLSRVFGIDGFHLVRPAVAEHGDYTVTAADASKLSQFQKELTRDSFFERVEINGNFLNLFLAKAVWQKELEQILELKEKYAALDIGRGQKANIEFISANPSGELHIGNGRGAFFGDALANVFGKCGYEVTREYFINDAKSSAQIKELGKTALRKGESYLSDYLKEILAELKPRLSKITDEGEAGFLVAQRVTKDIKNFVENELKIKMDVWFSENDLFEKGEIEKAIKKLPTHEKENALWVKTSSYGDTEDRVIKRFTGEPTYFLSDIAYHINKSNRSDLMVDIWGADHQGHVKRMMAVGRMLDFEDKIKILISQIVSLKEAGELKKMSKRKGDTVSLRELMKEVGLDAARFFYLSKSLNTHMDFDVALAKEQSKKNPIYYIQYSYARGHQIFVKAGEWKSSKVNFDLIAEPAEINLIKSLSEYPEILQRIIESQDYEIHKLTHYALELSANFHKFYEQSRVLVEDKNLQMARLALVRGYQIVLKDILDILGIRAPERM